MGKQRIWACMAALFVAGLVAIGLCGCNATTATVEDALEQRREELVPVVTEGLKHEGVLTIGLRNTSAPPFTSQTSDGPSGLDVEVASALANELGLPASFTWVEDVRGAVDNGCDIVMNVAANEASGFDVIGTYASSAIGLFHHGAQTVLPVEEVNGKRVALQEGSASQEVLHATMLQVAEVPCASLEEAFEALKSNGADLMACHVATGAYMCTRSGGIAFAGTINAPVDVGVAVAAGESPVKTAVSDAYTRLQENGVLEGIRRKWLGDLPLLTAESQIANIPALESQPSLVAMDEVGDVEDSGSSTVHDGSHAGSNAVILTVSD